MRFKAIDLFCGAGGLSVGLRKSGFNICLGVDIDKAALETYKYNLKRTKVLKEDIKNVTGEDITKLTGIKKSDNFLLAGCPPCQGFSNLGKRNIDDEKNELVYEYIRIINELEPTFILMENVPGMSTGIGKEIFKKVVKKLEAMYYVEHNTLNAADYGVPQIRKRLVLHGIRKDVYENIGLERKKILPMPTHSKERKKGYKKWITVREAIFDLPELEAGGSYEDEMIKIIKLVIYLKRILIEINRHPQLHLDVQLFQRDGMVIQLKIEDYLLGKQQDYSHLMINSNLSETWEK